MGPRCVSLRRSRSRRKTLAGWSTSSPPSWPKQAEQSSRLDCSACFGQDGGELVDHPAKVFRLDRDRRSETHRGPMGVLGEDPLGKEAFAHLTAGHQLRVDVDPGPQATRPNGDDAVTDEGLKAQAQLLTEHLCAFLVLPCGQELDDR